MKNDSIKQREQLLHQIYYIEEQNFDEVALAVFRYQAQYNPIYAQFLSFLRVSPKDVRTVFQIPFLPISSFKHHEIKCLSDWQAATIFTSSGTTGQQPSQHFVRDLKWYRQHSIRCFQKNYGSIKDIQFLALLPSYLERQGSSLVYMVEQFVQESHQDDNGFYLYNTDKLADVLAKAGQKNHKIILLGVTYALLDFAEQYAMPLPDNVILMETGGMKGKRKEMPKSAIHEQLCAAFQIEHIHSEYGMTELLSQAYSKGKGIFSPSPTLKVLIRDSHDPFYYQPFGKSGAINIIDLANIDSCAFIATDDLGRAYSDGRFEVLGRMDAAELRGCNLMLEML